MPLLQNIYPLQVDSVDSESSQQDSLKLQDSNYTAKIKQPPSRFFTSKREEPISFNPDPLPRVQNEWQIVTLAMSFLIVAFVRVSAKNFFRNLYSGLISRPIFKQLLRDGQLIPQIGKAPLLVAFLLVITVFIFQMNSVIPFIQFHESKSILLKGTTVLFVLGFYEISRFIIMHILGHVFKIKQIVREFVNNNIFFNTISTLLLMPLLFLSNYAYSSLIIYFGMAILLVLFIIRLIRAIIISSELSSFSGYQKFLYLCALEILPVFMVVKFLAGYISAI